MKRTLIAAAIALGIAIPTAHAKGFYEGKTLTYIIATSPGGGYDTYGRLVGKYLEKHLKAANIIFRNIPGAGHLVGANTLAASKPDGLTIGTFNTGLIYSEVLQRKGLQFDLRDLSWIGKAAADPRVMVLSTESKYHSFADLKAAKGKVKFAASGVGSASFTETHLLASAFDLPIEVIPGFNGNEGEMAMLRNELVGQVASLSAIEPFVKNGNAVIALAIGGKEQPQAKDLADTEKAHQIVSLVHAMSSLARLTAAPPKVPADRLEELRKAYMAALSDPDLLAEAKKLDIPIDPLDGAEVAKVVSDALNQSPETVKIIAAAVNVKAPTVKALGPLLSLEDGNKIVEFMSGDAKIKAKISGSRTKVTIGGAEATRKQLKVGMVCEIEYDPDKAGNEPASIACKN